MHIYRYRKQFRFIAIFILAMNVSFIASSLVRAEPIVAYITDLEGSRLRFEQFLKQSEAFEIGDDGKFHLKENAYFVFGGDAPDRYLGSLWVVSELVRLKEETPNRVSLILGNRDINKMRLTSELSPAALAKPAVRFHFANEEEWKKHTQPETRAERLKYIFSNTMTAPHAFELRRTEIAIELKTDEKTISDDQVAESFLSELEAGGRFRRFLELGELAHRIENTLFLHGGITNENLGIVPNSPKPRESVDHWIEDLNTWFHEGVHLWKESSHKWQGEGVRLEQTWLDYPMKNPGMDSKPESVVTARNSDKLNNPHLPASNIIDCLLRQGIERIVIGHTPTGDYPLILRTKDDRFEVVSADNSYAKSESFASLVHFKQAGLKRTTVQGMFTLNGESIKAVSDISLGSSTLIGKKFNKGLLLGYLARDEKVLVSFHYEEKYRVITNTILESSIDSVDLSEPERHENCEAILISKL